MLETVIRSVEWFLGLLGVPPVQGALGVVLAWLFAYGVLRTVLLARRDAYIATGGRKGQRPSRWRVRASGFVLAYVFAVWWGTRDWIGWPLTEALDLGLLAGAFYSLGMMALLDWWLPKRAPELADALKVRWPAAPGSTAGDETVVSY